MDGVSAKPIDSPSLLYQYAPLYGPFAADRLLVA